MKVLVVATKPPLPAVDGGRLVLWETLKALHLHGVELRLLAPLLSPLPAAARQALSGVATALLPPSRLRSWWRAGLSTLGRSEALALARHRHAAVARLLAAELTRQRPDLIHVEQLQALPQVLPAARAAGIPVLLRMQNVESDLWAQLAQQPGWRAALYAAAGRGLARDERRLLGRVARTLTLTPEDAARLQCITGLDDTCIVHHAPAFPAQWPAAPALRSTSDHAPIVLSGSAGWWPNTQALQWFLKQVLPLLPALDVHIYGGAASPVAGAAARLHWHPAPADSQEAFPEGAVVAVPLLQGSGIRMRILEAWARGLPVVASAVAAAGLEVQPGMDVLLPADTGPAAFATTLALASTDAALRARLVCGGRAHLSLRHDPVLQTEALLGHYRAALRHHQQTYGAADLAPAMGAVRDRSSATGERP